MRESELYSLRNLGSFNFLVSIVSLIKYKLITGIHNYLILPTFSYLALKIMFG